MNKKINLTNKAFGLIEVMIAAVILAISVLGVASLQSKSVATVVNTAYQEIAARHVSNMSNFMLSTSADYTPYLIPNPTNFPSIDANSCYRPKSCSKGNFYQSIAREWEDQIKNEAQLPNSSGSIKYSNYNATSKTMDVTITASWNNLDGSAATPITWQMSIPTNGDPALVFDS